ncbi:DUF4268 domain-containing protein [Chitinophagaceae bacterium MMS25-I14]
MYTKEQAAAIRETFWKTFGQYIAAHPSADGLRINWINYKTGIKHLSFRMHADNKTACIAIELSHPDKGIQELMLEQFAELRNVLEGSLEEEWTWILYDKDDNNKTVSRIKYCIERVSIYRQEDWPELISFFKPRIIALDEFWSVAQYHFDIFK